MMRLATLLPQPYAAGVDPDYVRAAFRDQLWDQHRSPKTLKMARKLRRINKELNGYEPEGREFESLRARHFFPLESIS